MNRTSCFCGRLRWITQDATLACGWKYSKEYTLIGTSVLNIRGNLHANGILFLMHVYFLASEEIMSLYHWFVGIAEITHLVICLVAFW